MIKVYLESLGCSKNLVDSELMLGQLIKNNMEIVDEPARADVILVNTCGFIDSAKEESIEVTLDMAEFKSKGLCKVLIMCGCLSGRYMAELPSELPEVDAFLGVKDYHRIASIIGEFFNQEIIEPKTCEQCFNERALLTTEKMAYLKISDGCDNCCSYCAIPLIRGGLTSRAKADLISEAKILREQGIEELVIISQDTTAYGVDLGLEDALADLLEELAKIDFTWIRLLYCYPVGISDRLLAVMADNANICNYFDLPLQHINDDILVAMNRRGTKSHIIERIAKIREMLPDVALRTTFMVGFDNESDEDFEELMTFARETKFHWVGAFTYSPQEDTLAYDFTNEIDEEVKNNRYEELMALLSRLSADVMERYQDRVLKVLVEEEVEEGLYLGRSEYHAPDVDGAIYIKGENLEIGKFYDVKITVCDVYDLIGEVM